MPTLRKKDSKKNVSCEYFEKVGNLPGKGLERGLFIKETGLLPRIYALPRQSLHTLLFFFYKNIFTLHVHKIN